MKTFELKIALPDSLAEEAQSKGLLKPAAVTSLIREACRRQRADRLMRAADRLAKVDSAPLSEAEVEAEIRAVREERRAQPT